LALHEVLPERRPLTLKGARQRGQRGVELGRVQLDQQVIEIAERVLQGGGLAA
jgi:hypothetical protein